MIEALRGFVSRWNMFLNRRILGRYSTERHKHPGRRHRSGDRPPEYYRGGRPKHTNTRTVAYINQQIRLGKPISSKILKGKEPK